MRFEFKLQLARAERELKRLFDCNSVSAGVKSTRFQEAGFVVYIWSEGKMALKKDFKIYRLKISLTSRFGEPGDIWRIIEIPAYSTLTGLHYQIEYLFGRWDHDHLWSFYFGGRDKSSSIEYASLIPKNPLFPFKGKAAANVKLYSLPFKTTENIYYLFDYGDEWWHRIEFLGEINNEDSVNYPRITEQEGESPEQYPVVYDDEEDDEECGDESRGELNVNLMDPMANLSAVLRLYPGAMSEYEAFGFVYGILSSPMSANITDYLPLIIGAGEPPKDDQASSELWVAFVLISSEIADSVEDGQVFEFLPDYPASVAGLAAKSQDLRDAIKGFLKGLEVGGADLDWHAGILSSLFAKLDSLRSQLSGLQAEGEGLLLAGALDNSEPLLTSLADLAKEINQTFLEFYNAITPERIEDADVKDEWLEDEEDKRIKEHPPITWKIGRNEPCPCGSGKKYKKCHGR